MRQLVAHFVPVADEVHRLQSGDDPECRLFQKIAEKGHYAGRTEPTNTRQGIYAAAPSGAFLASINSNDPRRVADMLARALEAWRSLPEEKLYAKEPLAARAGEIWRHDERVRPKDGLILRVHSRDVPDLDGLPGEGRDSPATEIAGWRADAWNRDLAWFRKGEARRLLPADLDRVGAKTKVPRELLERLARCHLVDNVRGQTPPYANEDVRSARLTSTIVESDEASVSIRLEGEFDIEKAGRWAVQGFRDMNEPARQRRGFAGKLLGRARYDRQRETFEAFEMIALGRRHGATQYNGRHDDPEGTMAIAFTLAGDSPEDQVAPALIWAYEW